MQQLLPTLALAAIVAVSVPQTVLAQTSVQTESFAMLKHLQTGNVEVTGASIYYEQRGDGPTLLILPGGPQDAGVFTALATELSDRFTVIAIDPRCNSRSSCEDRTNDLSVDQHADDAAAVIEALTDGGPAFVFGTSGGAQVGLNLAARYPALVRALIAHEPPSMMLLDDPAPYLAADQSLHGTYLHEGVDAAMAQFFAQNGLDAPEGEGEGDNAVPEFEMSAEVQETFNRVSGNFDYWLGHGMLPLSQYRPDIEILRAGAVPIVVALGEGSIGQPIHEMGQALASALSGRPAGFPGDHMGFETDLDGFAAAIEKAVTEQSGSL